MNATFFSLVCELRSVLCLLLDCCQLLDAASAEVYGCSLIAINFLTDKNKIERFYKSRLVCICVAG